MVAMSNSFPSFAGSAYEMDWGVVLGGYGGIQYPLMLVGYFLSAIQVVTDRVRVVLSLFL